MKQYGPKGLWDDKITTSEENNSTNFVVKQYGPKGLWGDETAEVPTSATEPTSEVRSEAPTAVTETLNGFRTVMESGDNPVEYAAEYQPNSTFEMDTDAEIIKMQEDAAAKEERRKNYKPYEKDLDVELESLRTPLLSVGEKQTPNYFAQGKTSLVRSLEYGREKLQLDKVRESRKYDTSAALAGEAKRWADEDAYGKQMHDAFQRGEISSDELLGKLQVARPEAFENAINYTSKNAAKRTLNELDGEVELLWDEYRNKDKSFGDYFLMSRGVEEESNNIQIAREHIDDAKQLIENVEKNAGFWKGAGQTITDIDSWLSLHKIVDSAQIKAIGEKFDEVGYEGLSKSERAVVDALATQAAVEAYYSQDLSRMFKAGQGIAHSGIFMAGMALFPSGKIAKGISGAIMKSMTKGAQKALGTGTKFFANATGEFVAANAQTAAIGLGTSRLIDETIGRTTGYATYDNEGGRITFSGMDGRESLGGAIAREYIAELADVITERGSALIGSALPKSAAKQTVLGRMLEALETAASNNPTKWRKFLAGGAKNVKAFGKAASWDGLGAELLEEEAANIITSLSEGTKYDSYGKGLKEEFGQAFSADAQIDLLVNLAIMQGMFGGANVVTDNIYRKDIEKAKGTMREYFGDEFMKEVARVGMDVDVLAPMSRNKVGYVVTNKYLTAQEKDNAIKSAISYLAHQVGRKGRIIDSMNDENAEQTTIGNVTLRGDEIDNTLVLPLEDGRTITMQSDMGIAIDADGKIRLDEMEKTALTTVKFNGEEYTLQEFRREYPNVDLTQMVQARTLATEENTTKRKRVLDEETTTSGELEAVEETTVETPTVGSITIEERADIGHEDDTTELPVVLGNQTVMISGEDLETKAIVTYTGKDGVTHTGIVTSADGFAFYKNGNINLSETSGAASVLLDDGSTMTLRDFVNANKTATAQRAKEQLDYNNSEEEKAKRLNAQIQEAQRKGQKIVTDQQGNAQTDEDGNVLVQQPKTPEAVEETGDATPEVVTVQQARELTPEEQAAQQEAEEKQAFYASLPLKQAGPNKGKIDYDELTPEQEYQLEEYEGGSGIEVLQEGLEQEQAAIDNIESQKGKGSMKPSQRRAALREHQAKLEAYKQALAKYQPQEEVAEQQQQPIVQQEQQQAVVEEQVPIVETAEPVAESAPVVETERTVQYNLSDEVDVAGVVGRSLTEEEAQLVIENMREYAELAEDIELTPENWGSLFGDDGIVETPIGNVKMGENQYLKLLQKKRESYFGMIRPTIESPDMILEESDPKDGAERDTKLLFVKTFVKSDGSRYVHFESVTVQKDSLEVSISNHEVDVSTLKKKMQNDKVLHLNDTFLDSDMRLIEPRQEGSDLVPTPNDNKENNAINNTTDTVETQEGKRNDTTTPQNTVSSENKDNASSEEKQEKARKVTGVEKVFKEAQGFLNPNKNTRADKSAAKRWIERVIRFQKNKNWGALLESSNKDIADRAESIADEIDNKLNEICDAVGLNLNDVRKEYEKEKTVKKAESTRNDIDTNGLFTSTGIENADRANRKSIANNPNSFNEYIVYRNIAGGSYKMFVFVHSSEIDKVNTNVYAPYGEKIIPLYDKEGNIAAIIANDITNGEQIKTAFVLSEDKDGNKELSTRKNPNLSYLFLDESATLSVGGKSPILNVAKRLGWTAGKITSKITSKEYKNKKGETITLFDYLTNRTKRNIFLGDNSELTESIEAKVRDDINYINAVTRDSGKIEYFNSDVLKDEQKRIAAVVSLIESEMGTKGSVGGVSKNALQALNDMAKAYDAIDKANRNISKYNEEIEKQTAIANGAKTREAKENAENAIKKAESNKRKNKDKKLLATMNMQESEKKVVVSKKKKIKGTLKGSRLNEIELFIENDGIEASEYADIFGEGGFFDEMSYRKLMGFDDEAGHSSKVQKKIIKTIAELEKEIGVKCHIIHSLDELKEMAEDNPLMQQALTTIEQGGRFYGFTGSEYKEAYLYLPECSSVKEAVKTYLHECVGHIGMRAILGKNYAKENYDMLFDLLPLEHKIHLHAKIANGMDFDEAMDEQIAEFVEDVRINKFTMAWERFCAKIVELVNNSKLAKKFGIRYDNNSIKHLIFAAARRLQDGNMMVDDTIITQEDVDFINEENYGEVRYRGKGEVDWNITDEEYVEKLHQIESIEPKDITDAEPMTQKEAEAYVSNLKNGENKIDKRKITFPINTIGKILRHKGFDYSLIVRDIKDIFDNSVPIFDEVEVEQEGHKKHNNFLGYHHYLGKILYQGKEYYVRFTVQEINTKKKDFINNQLHSTQITDVSIVSADTRVNTGNSPATANTSTFNDAKLQRFFDLANAALKNDIRFRSKGRFAGVKEWGNDFVEMYYQEVHDQHSYLDNAIKRAEKKMGRKLPDSENPYLLHINADRAAAGWQQVFMMTNYISLADSLKGMGEKMDAVGLLSYVRSKGGGAISGRELFENYMFARDYNERLQQSKQRMKDAWDDYFRASVAVSNAYVDFNDELDEKVERGEMSKDEAEKQLAEFKNALNKAYNIEELSKAYDDLLKEFNEARAHSLKWQEAFVEKYKIKPTTLIAEVESRMDTSDFWEEWNGASQSIRDLLYEKGVISEERYNAMNERKYYVPERSQDYKEDGGESARIKASRTRAIEALRKSGFRESLASDPLFELSHIAIDAARASFFHNANAKIVELYFSNEYVRKELEAQGIYVSSGFVDEDGNAVSLEAFESNEAEKGRIQGEINALNETNKSLRDDLKTASETEKAKIKDAIKKIKDEIEAKKVKVDGLPKIMYGKPTTVKKSRDVKVYVGGVEYDICIVSREKGFRADSKAVRLEMALSHTNNDNPFGEWSKVAKALSYSYTTANLDFIAKNPIRDIGYNFINAFATEDPMLAFGIAKGITKTPEYLFYIAKYIYSNKIDDSTETGRRLKSFIEGGGLGGFSLQYSDKAKLEKVIEEYEKKSNGEISKNPFEYIANIAEAFEMLSRFNVYNVALDRGKSSNEALNLANNLNINYDVKGAGKSILMKSLRAFVPFTNASLSAITILFQGAKKGHKKENVARFYGTMLTLVAFGFAVRMLHDALLGGVDEGDDEDKNKENDLWRMKEWFQLKEFSKYNNNYINVGSVRLPIDPRLSILTNMGMRMYECYRGVISGKDLLHYTFHDIIQNATPINILFPNVKEDASLVKIADILGDEKYSVKDVRDSYLYNDRSSFIARLIEENWYGDEVKSLGEVGEKIDYYLSAKRLDALATTFIPATVRDLISLLATGLSNNEEIDIANIPIVGAFYNDVEKNEQMNIDNIIYNLTSTAYEYKDYVKKSDMPLYEGQDAKYNINDPELEAFSKIVGGESDGITGKVLKDIKRIDETNPIRFAKRHRASIEQANEAIDEVYKTDDEKEASRNRALLNVLNWTSKFNKYNKQYRPKGKANVNFLTGLKQD